MLLPSMIQLPVRPVTFSTSWLSCHHSQVTLLKTVFTFFCQDPSSTPVQPHLVLRSVLIPTLNRFISGPCLVSVFSSEAFTSVISSPGTFCHQLPLGSVPRIPATLGLCPHPSSVVLVPATGGVPNGANRHHRVNKHMKWLTK